MVTAGDNALACAEVWQCLLKVQLCSFYLGLALPVPWKLAQFFHRSLSMANSVNWLVRCIHCVGAFASIRAA